MRDLSFAQRQYRAHPGDQCAAVDELGNLLQIMRGRVHEEERAVRAPFLQQLQIGGRHRRYNVATPL